MDKILAAKNSRSLNFLLDPKLKRDSHHILNLRLCQIRLIDDQDYPWFILIPMKPNIVEITDLSEEDYEDFCCELRIITAALKDKLMTDKLNIAAIGNIVHQLHVHIVVRFKNDKLFPKTVWGYPLNRYESSKLELKIREYKTILLGEQFSYD